MKLKRLFTYLFSVLLGAITLSACNITIGGIKHKVEFYYDNEVGEEVLLKTVETGGRERIDVPSESPMEDYKLRGWYTDKGEWKHPFASDDYLYSSLKNDIKVYAHLDKYEATYLSILDSSHRTATEVELKTQITANYTINWLPSDFTFEEAHINVKVADPEILDFELGDTSCKKNISLKLTGLVDDAETTLTVSSGNITKELHVSVKHTYVIVEFYITNLSTNYWEYDKATKMCEIVTSSKEGYHVKFPTIDETYIDDRTSGMLNPWSYPRNAQGIVTTAREIDQFKEDTKLYADWEMFNLNTNISVESQASSNKVITSFNRSGLLALSIDLGSSYVGVKGKNALVSSQQSLQYIYFHFFIRANYRFDYVKEDSPFYYCTNLHTVVAPLPLAKVFNRQSLKTFIQHGREELTVPSEGFKDYENLESITLSSTVETVSEYGFYNLPKLKELKFDEGTSSFKYIKPNNFLEVPLLETSTEGVLSYFSLNENSHQVLIDCDSEATEITIHHDTVSIGESALTGCFKIASISYDGTMEEFSYIYRKQYDWHKNVKSSVTSVHCLDGEASLDDRDHPGIYA